MGRKLPHCAPLRQRILAVIPLITALPWPLLAQASWPVGETRPIRALGSNRGVHVEVLSAALLERYGETPAKTGRRLVVLRTRWENDFPLTLLEGTNVPTEYRIPHLGDHIYLVANGKEALRLLPEAGDLPGHLPTQPFSLPRLGSVLEGNLVFDAPDHPFTTLELRFYDYAHGHFSVRLAGASATEPERPLSPPLRNEVLEVAAFGVTRAKEHGGLQAPEGMAFITIDLRARSLFTVEADATAFDPKAPAGARVQVGTVADWKESRRYLQLVADGEVAFAPLASSPLAEEPRFLPDIFTGGDAVFLGPAKATSLELRCDMPNARSSLDGKEFRPLGLTLPLEGQRPALTVVKPLVGPIADEPFEVVVTAVRPVPLDTRAKADPDAAALAAARVVSLDVTAANTGKKGEFLQPLEQLQLALSNGQAVSLDRDAQPARPALALLWVPAGERRSFTAAYRVPASETRLRLLYRGGTFAKAFELPALSPVAPPPAIPAATSVAAGKPPEPPPTGAGEKPPAEGEARPAAPATATKPPAPETAKPAPPAVATKPGAEAQPAAEVVARTPREPKGLAGVGLTPEEVNAAIDRGADFLWRFILERDVKESHKRFGQDAEHYIAALALVHSGAHRKHADFDASLRQFLGGIDPVNLRGYEAAIVCMLIEAYGDPSFLPQLEAASQFLLELQGEKGSWNYRRWLPRAFFTPPEDGNILQVSGGRPLEEPGQETAHARKTDWMDGVDGDNSVSQYALLGLHAASRSGFRIDPEVWRRSLESYRERQGKDGNWSYSSASTSGYGSMTCAGICSVALARFELGDKAPGADPAIERGLAWLEKSFSLEAHPQHYPPEQWRYYYLYSLERVGRILDVEFIGAHEWYPLGARHLLDSRTGDGGWIGKFEELDPRLATSFALLFLTRATPSLKPVAAPRGGDGTLKTGIQLPKGSRYYFILDASGSMSVALDGQTKWDIARGAVASLVEELPDNAEVALRVYGHRKRAIEAGASEDTALEVPLRRLVRKDMLAKLESLKPRGKTPMARSLLEAKRDLGNVSEDNPVTVVLLTDGGEDTLPRQDPVAAAAELATLKGVRFQIVGFDIGREDWGAQLEAMAQKGEGQYWPAGNADSLIGDLRSAVFGVPTGFTVADEGGRAVGAGRFGETLTLHEGSYIFRTSYAGVKYEELFRINTAAATSVVFNAAKVARLRLPPSPASAEAPAAASGRPGAPGAKPAGSSVKPGRPAPVAQPKFCSGCGKPLVPNAKFCTNCGKKVGG